MVDDNRLYRNDSGGISPLAFNTGDPVADYNAWAAATGHTQLVDNKHQPKSNHMFALTETAWEGLTRIATDQGFLFGPQNRPNVTRLLEAIGQGWLTVEVAQSP